MKVLVTGGRDYDNVDALWSELDWWHYRQTITCIIQGGAKGADMIAAGWAVSREVDCVLVMAEWDKHGKAAGPLRNQRMIDEYKPDMVFACPGGRGTADMVRRAKKAEIRVIEVPSNLIDKETNSD